MQPRGIRNNNPGNIRWGDGWQGLVAPHMRTDKSFCQFTEPSYGIRAICKILLNYGSKTGQPGVGAPGIDTVREIISRWAPPNENDTEAYIASVARALDVHPNAHIDVTEPRIMRGLVVSIIRHENGQQPYSPALIDNAMRMAGIV
ncbi:structural protein P5 [Cupriavidus taiwanensis]|uniref:structural protein P5 n=1 Tax=Cupriavidus taiwanensis TaxID=164546 RepID=UPI002541FA4D|nr:structural protein P5 [Cupriavidus taiwanensis]MDK3025562.1 structural protein P5 [Cupriavidus taiwanensis]